MTARPPGATIHTPALSVRRSASDRGGDRGAAPTGLFVVKMFCQGFSIPVEVGGVHRVKLVELLRGRVILLPLLGILEQW